MYIVEPILLDVGFALPRLPGDLRGIYQNVADDLGFALMASTKAFILALMVRLPNITLLGMISRFLLLELRQGNLRAFLNGEMPVDLPQTCFPGRLLRSSPDASRHDPGQKSSRGSCWMCFRQMLLRLKPTHLR